MTVLVIDNYDSFVYNLVQYVGEFDSEVVVRRNDALDLRDVRDLDPDGIVVSPGPGTPREAGISIFSSPKPTSPSSASVWVIRHSAPPRARQSATRQKWSTASPRP
jgi:hypothetical protein